VPALWVDVPASCTLADLHDVLQVAVGRTDSHLHQFVAEEASYGVPDRDGWQGQRDEAGVRLTDLPGRFIYVYDFGDGWGYKVEVLGSGGGQPGCVDGGDAAPPEDCGGPYGYAELLRALADPEHVDHDRCRGSSSDSGRLLWAATPPSHHDLPPGLQTATEVASGG